MMRHNWKKIATENAETGSEVDDRSKMSGRKVLEEQKKNNLYTHNGGWGGGAS